MREIVMDASNWDDPEVIYAAFFEGVGAPTWHGRNFNALRDSIAVGRINRVEVPYLLRIINYASIKPGAKKMANEFVQFIRELHESGVPVDVEIDN